MPSKVCVMSSAFTWDGTKLYELKARFFLILLFPSLIFDLRFPLPPNLSPRSYSIRLTWHFNFSFRHCYFLFFPFYTHTCPGRHGTCLTFGTRP